MKPEIIELRCLVYYYELQQIKSYFILFFHKHKTSEINYTIVHL
jgi:hypothetical protein